MKTVYLITKGEYADYRVYAIYSTKELAEQNLQRFHDDYDQAQIEECLMDIDSKLSLFVIDISFEGDILDHHIRPVQITDSTQSSHSLPWHKEFLCCNIIAETFSQAQTEALNQLSQYQSEN